MTAPAVSPVLAVYAAVQVFPLVFVYVTEVSLISSPPDLNVTTGVPIVSLAVNERVTTLSTLAKVVVELSDAMLTELSVGTALSLKVAVLFDCVVDAAFPAASKIDVAFTGRTFITSEPSAIPDVLNLRIQTD